MAFSKYIDSILDLLLLPHAEIEDHMDGKKEILFFGWVFFVASPELRVIMMLHVHEYDYVVATRKLVTRRMHVLFVKRFTLRMLHSYMCMHTRVNTYSAVCCTHVFGGLFLRISLSRIQSRARPPCSPDENTADLMDWACLHARARGYPYWKAVTTGKNPSLGGVPHDVYGMTTRGVRAFVEGVQGRLGLDPRVLKKVQTGGPDGDLGSNEILQANEHTIAIVDGSGVLCDTDGLNQQELVRLAHARKMVSFFDVSLLSPRGYFVSVEATDFK